jgi:hypothetical protein
LGGWRYPNADVPNHQDPRPPREAPTSQRIDSNPELEVSNERAQLNCSSGESFRDGHVPLEHDLFSQRIHQGVRIRTEYDAFKDRRARQFLFCSSVFQNYLPTTRRLGGPARSRHTQRTPRPTDNQLFFYVCAMKPPSCYTTEPLHFGHFTSPFSRSEMVKINSKGFWHFSHTNS